MSSNNCLFTDVILISKLVISGHHLDKEESRLGDMSSSDLGLRLRTLGPSLRLGDFAFSKGERDREREREGDGEREREREGDRDRDRDGDALMLRFSVSWGMLKLRLLLREIDFL